MHSLKHTQISLKQNPKSSATIIEAVQKPIVNALGKTEQLVSKPKKRKSLSVNYVSQIIQTLEEESVKVCVAEPQVRRKKYKVHVRVILNVAILTI